MISEDKILDFIAKNDKRKGAKLDQYKDTIIRLLNHNISKKDIYNFIKEEDSSIGSQINFYKYISRNIDKSLPKDKIKPCNKKEKKQEKVNNVLEPKKEIKKTTPVITSSKTSVLKQDFNLMDYED